MEIHKNTRLTPLQQEEIFAKHHRDHIKVNQLANDYHVSRPTIYKILSRGRQRDFSVHRSVNARFRTLQWSLRRLAKIEKDVEERLMESSETMRHILPRLDVSHEDTRRLPLLKGQKQTDPGE